MYASAFMRTAYRNAKQDYTTSGEPAYMETAEVMLKKLLHRSSQSKP